MLTFLGPRSRFCDHLSRRSFLQVGGWALGGLSLPGLLRARRRPVVGRTSRSSWSTCPAGWPTRTRSTSSPTPRPRSAASSSRSPPNVPGVQVGELLPRLAAVHGQGGAGPLDRRPGGRALELAEHDRLPAMGIAQRERRPHFGSRRRQGAGAGRSAGPAVRRPVPDDAAQAVQQPRTPASSAAPAAAVKVDGDEVAVMKNWRVPADRLDDRKGCSSTIDQLPPRRRRRRPRRHGHVPRARRSTC